MNVTAKLNIANKYRSTLSDGSDAFAVLIWDEAKGGAKKLATLDCEDEAAADELVELINDRVSCAY